MQALAECIAANRMTTRAGSSVRDIYIGEYDAGMRVQKREDVRDGHNKIIYEHSLRLYSASSRVIPGELQMGGKCLDPIKSRRCACTAIGEFYVYGKIGPASRACFSE